MKEEHLNDTNPLKLVDLKFICESTGLSQAFIYKMISSDLFPKPLKLGRASRWYLSEFKDWMEKRHRM